jgi:hypothetical protein
MLCLSGQGMATTKGRPRMFYGYGIVGLLILILDIYVILQIVSSGGDPGMKLLWIIIVLILPLIGPLLYFLLGGGGGRRTV